MYCCNILCPISVTCIGTGDGLIPSDTVPSPVTMMIYLQIEPMTLTWSEVYKKIQDKCQVNLKLNHICMN